MNICHGKRTQSQAKTGKCLFHFVTGISVQGQRTNLKLFFLIVTYVTQQTGSETASACGTLIGFLRIRSPELCPVSDRGLSTIAAKLLLMLPDEETATHIGIREAEDWFRPIDLAKECDIYISSRSGSHKEIPITYGYTQDPFKKIDHKTLNQRLKENYPQYLERENKNCFICGDSSHYARDCKKRFKSKESNDHIHNRINVNTLKVESEKQNSEEFAQQLQYVNIFVENQPVTALIDSGCQIPVLNSSLIRVQTPSEEIITLSSCFGEKRMVEVKPINISLNQHSTSLVCERRYHRHLDRRIYYTSQCIF
ncbi:hypothetical protein TNCV_3308121 [Trichonephila clavipes]|nr:hypothetical protein TNCV_3308121 [Trichonephila clavipes]